VRLTVQGEGAADGAGLAQAWLDDRRRVYGYLCAGERNLALHGMLRKAVDLAAEAGMITPAFFDATDADALRLLREGVSLGAATLTRVTGTDALIGGYVRPNGSDRPEYLVLFGDGTYVHSTFYYENDPETATASFFETARTAGMRQGTWARGGPGNVGTPSDPGNTNPNVLDFGQNTTVSFNGSLAIPSSPGVASVQSDGSISATNLRIVKLGTAPGAQAVTGFSEATRSRLWSGRYFSRTVSVAGVNRTQYVYVRGPNDVLTFLQAPTGSDVTLACPTAGAIVDFTTVAPTDGKLKQFVIGTGTAASAGYAQRRLNVGQPGAGNLVTYTPITRPSNATARCALPL